MDKATDGGEALLFLGAIDFVTKEAVTVTFVKGVRNTMMTLKCFAAGSTRLLQAHLQATRIRYQNYGPQTYPIYSSFKWYAIA